MGAPVKLRWVFRMGKCLSCLKKPKLTLRESQIRNLLSSNSSEAIQVDSQERPALPPRHRVSSVPIDRVQAAKATVEAFEEDKMSTSSEEEEADTVPDLKPKQPAVPKIPLNRVSSLPGLDTLRATRNPEATDERSYRAMQQSKLDAEDAICSKITPNLYLGSNTVAKNRELLASKGITHVANTAGLVCENYFINVGSSAPQKYFIVSQGEQNICECCFFERDRSCNT
eukprot:c18721_g1_i1.p1 GENE.c18721_g1_i1~~c18721_g1_i1.p1  ORF type:complete len:228 (+),score=29.37 c18721_g1_i1:2-685(+)